MPVPWWWILVGLAGGAAAWLVWRPLAVAAGRSRLARARKGFHKQREWLEAKFLSLAAAHQVRVDSPRWTDCEFDDAVCYVRRRSTGELSAFVAITVALEGVSHPASSPGDLIGNLRAGTAIFRFDRDHWETEGRLLLNLSPGEALRRYHDDLDLVGQESAERPAKMK
ncbi:MAG: hypothetical protein ABSF26_04380 [Thermoguttaceae bacterium]|jgi:hypothetical protein